MRSKLWISLALLLTVLSGGWMLSRRTIETSDTLTAAAAELRCLSEAGDWDSAAQSLTGWQRRWETMLPGLQMTIDHADTDQVSLALLTLQAGIRTHNAPLCALGCVQLEESARHLHHRDALRWQNIF